MSYTDPGSVSITVRNFSLAATVWRKKTIPLFHIGCLLCCSCYFFDSSPKGRFTFSGIVSNSSSCEPLHLLVIGGSVIASERGFIFNVSIVLALLLRIWSSLFNGLWPLGLFHISGPISLILKTVLIPNLHSPRYGEERRLTRILSWWEYCQLKSKDALMTVYSG